MSLVSYNGITLQVVKVLAHDRRPVYNGSDYLYTEHRLRFHCYYNPGATAYVLPNGPNAVNPETGPVVAPLAVTGPATDVSIRHQLSQPRRRLIFTVGITEVLVSPRIGQTVDAQNGPFPRVNSITVSGNKTCRVDWEIVTYVNECYLYKQTPGVILSHRWSMRHDINEDFFTTKVMHGRAVFNTERLAALGAKADDFRKALFHPIEDGFQRGPIDVQVDEDGGVLEYTIRDYQRSVQILASSLGVTRIEASHSATIDIPGLEGFLAGPGLELSSALGRVVLDRGSIGSGALNILGKAVAGVLRNTPLLARAAAPGVGVAAVMVHEIRAAVFGNPLALRSSLQSVAEGVVSARIQGVTDFGIDAFNTTTRVTHDLMGAYVEAVGTFFAGPIASRLISGRAATMFPAMPRGESIGGILHSGPGAANPRPRGDGLSRGSYLGSLVTAALLEPCATPSGGTLPPAKKDRNPTTGAEE